MEDTTKYGSSTVLLTSVSEAKEKPNDIEGFPCVSPLDDGEARKAVCVFITLFSRRSSAIESSCCFGKHF